MREERDIDLDYHVRHSALPHPGGQRELGILVSRLHGHQLDLHRPLWEAHLIEGLEGNRFAIYTKMHHSLIDGVSGMRMMLRTLSTDPEQRDMPAFWSVGGGASARSAATTDGGPWSVRRERRAGGAKAIAGLGRAAAADLGRAAIDDRSLTAPYRAPSSALVGSARRPAPLRHAAVRARADQGAGAGRRTAP